MIPAGATRRRIVDPRTVQIARDASNILGIEITCEGAAATVGWFRLRWWNYIKVTRKPGEEAETYWMLNDDQIEFVEAEDQSSNSAISSQDHT